MMMEIKKQSASRRPRKVTHPGFARLPIPSMLAVSPIDFTRSLVTDDQVTLTPH